MAKIKFSEVNQFVQNLYEQTNISSLLLSHASVVRAWFVANMTKIGRYSHRDFERFGNLTPSNDNQGRQDGWVSMTEEVSDPDHISYGTGVLYVQGELELPEGNPIENDCFSNQTPEGGMTDYIQDYVSGSTRGAYTNTDIGQNPSIVIERDPNDPESPLEGFINGFSNAVIPNGGIFPYAMIYQSVSGIQLKNHIRSASGNAYNINGGYSARLVPSATSTTPSEFNDAEVYELDNERNNYPMVIINSAQPESINHLLVSQISNKNGMYDDTLPAILDAHSQNELPVKSGGMKITARGREMILAHISPLKAET